MERVLDIIECGELSQNIEEHSRLGEPKENGKRLLKVIMESENDVDKILSSKGLLRDSSIPFVYINEDLSRSERIKAYHARLRKRNTAAEAVENSGGDWGRANTLGDLIQEQRRASDNRGMGGRRNSAMPPQRRKQNEERVALPEGWEGKVGIDSGRVFYKNVLTGEKQFEFPTEPARRQRSGDRAYRRGHQGQDERGQIINRGRANSGSQRNGNRNTTTPAGNDGGWGNLADW